jgi:hypothetical protein
MTTQWRRATIVIIILLLAGAATWAYMESQRHTADALASTQATSLLIAAFHDRYPSPTFGKYDSEAPNRSIKYLDSASARRTKASQEIGTLWEAYRVVHRLDQQHAEGATATPVSLVPGAGTALAVYPEVRTYVVDVAGSPAFTKLDVAANFLAAQALTKTVPAIRALLLEQYADTGIDIPAATSVGEIPSRK